MSVQDELYQRAWRATEIALDRVDRNTVIQIIHEHGGTRVIGTRVSYIPLAKLPAYIDEVEALPAKPKTVELPVAFNIGDKVVGSGRSREYSVGGTVAGYEVRYILRNMQGVTENFSRRADYLKSAPVARPLEYTSVFFDESSQWTPEEIDRMRRRKFLDTSG